MELDKRIKSGKKPFTCFDTEVAKKFIGKKCYFSDYKCFFENLTEIENNLCSDYRIDTLTHIDNTGSEHVFKDDCGHWFNFCLPCEWVKPEEPECRPYTDKEFLTLFDLGKFHSIRIRSESYSRVIITSIYHIDNILYIRMNGDKSEYDVMWLFRHCEYFDGKDWKPFGIKE